MRPSASQRRAVAGHDRAPVEFPPTTVAFLNALTNLVAAPTDPWAKYPPVLGVEHVAEILDIQPPAVSEAARRGTLPMVKVCGKWRIDQLEFRRLCGYRGSVPVGRDG